MNVVDASYDTCWICSSLGSPDASNLLRLVWLSKNALDRIKSLAPFGYKILRETN